MEALRCRGRGKLIRMPRRLIWLTIYAVAMAYLESAVVMYLRAIYYPDGFSLPLVILEPSIAVIEVGREIATVVMLLGVTVLVSADRWEWFLTFCLSFGIWDVFYYIWLWVFLRWPPSLLTWDVLFLIPVPWVGPVLAPLLVSVALVVGSLLILRLKMQGMRIRFPALLWLLAVTGGILVFVSFTLDFQIALQQMEPPPFRWGLFAAGLTLSVVTVAFGVSRLAFPLNRRA